MLRKLTIGLVLLALALAAFFFATRTSRAPQDPVLAAAFAFADRTHSYVQEVSTEVRFPSQTLVIEGMYRLDRPGKRYASVATTTVRAQRGPKRSFTLSNVSLGADVYARVDTADAALAASFPRVGAWERFPAREIPDRYAGIAIPGPILDNLRILEQNGSYLSPADEPVADGELMRYRFSLAPAHRGVTEGTLAVLLGRIATGTVSLWVTPSGEPRQLVFDASGYHSTTTLSSFDVPLGIEAPLVQ